MKPKLYVFGDDKNFPQDEGALHIARIAVERLRATLAAAQRLGSQGLTQLQQQHEPQALLLARRLNDLPDNLTRILGHQFPIVDKWWFERFHVWKDMHSVYVVPDRDGLSDAAGWFLQSFRHLDGALYDFQVTCEDRRRDEEETREWKRSAARQNFTASSV
jgi:NUMB domain